MYKIIVYSRNQIIMALGYQHQPHEMATYAVLFKISMEPGTQTTDQAYLSYAKELVHLQDVLHHNSQDVDEVRYCIIITLEKMLNAVNKSDMANNYSPALTYDRIITEPKILGKELIQAAKRVLSIISSPASMPQKGNEEAILERSLNTVINTTMKLVNVGDLHTLLARGVEYKATFPGLRIERQNLIQANSHLEYQLKATTIYPLQYQVGRDSHSNTLHHFLLQQDIPFLPEQSIYLETVEGYLYQAITKMRDEQNWEMDQISDHLSSITGHIHIDLTHVEVSLAPLLRPAASILTCPTYLEAWFRANPNYTLQLNLEPTLLEDLSIYNRPVPTFLKSQTDIPESTPLFTPVNRKSRIYLDTPPRGEKEKPVTGKMRTARCHKNPLQESQSTACVSQGRSKNKKNLDNIAVDLEKLVDDIIGETDNKENMDLNGPFTAQTAVGLVANNTQDTHYELITPEPLEEQQEEYSTGTAVLQQCWNLDNITK